jgi:hypothetical protein
VFHYCAITITVPFESMLGPQPNLLESVVINDLSLNQGLEKELSSCLAAADQLALFALVMIIISRPPVLFIEWTLYGS